MNLNEVVYGENVEALMPGLLAIANKMRMAGDGLYRASVALEPEQGNPLRRALMRVEAELLLADADVVGTALDEERAHEQRAADALARLVETLGHPERDGLD